ncbi:MULTISPECIES: DMT family transporter [unclassified Myroides]|uniref:DMT family transporter n=1 Tax=unclassified Myroides TaxID=2642485 RepID=UPI0015FD797A|nr:MULTISPECIES: DMT family transporter [unclassified Myroides]MBB1150500.1 DMT family transporter [Myroides sp. NP-2]MDM1407471.1 DMT family transporter [Myroides sp. DF42-4-2]
MKATAVNNTSSGWINGFIGVLLFSGSMPATKVAVLSLDPIFVTLVRALVAAVLAGIFLYYTKASFPTKLESKSIILIAGGAVIGFPLLSSLALQHMTAARSLVFVGTLPLSTAIFAVLRGKEKPKPLFWLFALLGSGLVVAFAYAQQATSSITGDLLMLAAIILCGLAYAEGAVLTKSMGGSQVISWAIIYALPILLPCLFFFLPPSLHAIQTDTWVSLLYLGTMSMFTGFIFWYKGLAQGGIATVGQLQLLQPFFGLALAALFLNESVSVGMIGVTLGVVLSVAASKKFA